MLVQDQLLPGIPAGALGAVLPHQPGVNRAEGELQAQLRGKCEVTQVYVMEVESDVVKYEIKKRYT